jgi:hypothetical protein
MIDITRLTRRQIVLKNAWHITGDADRHQVAGKMGARNQARVGGEAQRAFVNTGNADRCQRLAHAFGALDAPLRNSSRPPTSAGCAASKPRPTMWIGTPFHSMEISTPVTKAMPASSAVALASARPPNIIVIGQRPEVDAIGRGALCHLMRRQQAVRNMEWQWKSKLAGVTARS